MCKYINAYEFTIAVNGCVASTDGWEKGLNVRDTYHTTSVRGFKRASKVLII